MEKYKQVGHYWELLHNHEGRLLTRREAIKQEVEKLETIHYIPNGSGGFSPILRDPKTAPSVDEVVENIKWQVSYRMRI
ncbi:hypothetical protein LCGC14_1405600 [marine sediment metagenome]|uniref:Uncharacterized protein n=1 Tax=marine sediment metagenome TaxID=412755 RepID=A0A0F9JVR8_9ZZZZ